MLCGERQDEGELISFTFLEGGHMLAAGAQGQRVVSVDTKGVQQVLAQVALHVHRVMQSQTTQLQWRIAGVGDQCIHHIHTLSLTHTHSLSHTLTVSVYVLVNVPMCVCALVWRERGWCGRAQGRGVRVCVCV